MTTLKWFTMAFVALNIASCAFDKNSNSDTRKELDDRAALYEKYNRITGTYSGTAGPYDVKISFFTVEKKKGETADGQPKFLPVLMARYFVKNAPDPQQVGIFLEAKYIAETSEIFMSDESGSLGIHGFFSGDTLTGEVTINGNHWGNLNTRLSSRTSAGENSANARAERDASLKKLYEPIVGRYKGAVILPTTSQNPSFSAEIRIVIGQVKDKDGYYMPALQGFYWRQPKGIPTGVDSLSMIVDYKTDTNPPYIGLVTYGGRVDADLTIAGTIQIVEKQVEGKKVRFQVISGDYTDKRGNAGTARFEMQLP